MGFELSGKTGKFKSQLWRGFERIAWEIVCNYRRYLFTLFPR